MDKLRIGVLFGGRSGEHEVSLMSVRSVMAALDPEKYVVTPVGIDLEGRWWVGEGLLDLLARGEVPGESAHSALEDATDPDRRQSFSAVSVLPDPSRKGLYAIRLDHSQTLELLTDLDVVFPVLHGTFGEDGTLQGLLELADLAYVGAGVLGSALGMDKGVFKDVMRANGIPVVESVLVLRSEIESDLQNVVERAEHLAGYPLFTKPANLGSSVGITKCRSRGDLVEGLYEAARFDRRIMIERGVQGRELEVSVLGNDKPLASLAGEIIPSREFYSYEAKYIDGSSALLIPAQLPDEIMEQVREMALQAYKAIDCAGLARVDFFLENESLELYVSEINTIPGFTTISMYPKLWEASGMKYPALVDRLVELALERKNDRDRTERRYRREL